MTTEASTARPRTYRQVQADGESQLERDGSIRAKWDRAAAWLPDEDPRLVVCAVSLIRFARRGLLDPGPVYRREVLDVMRRRGWLREQREKEDTE